jgi:hypothetical protein
MLKSILRQKSRKNNIENKYGHTAERHKFSKVFSDKNLEKKRKKYGHTADSHKFSKLFSIVTSCSKNSLKVGTKQFLF